jgi:hypothetical protein
LSKRQCKICKIKPPYLNFQWLIGPFSIYVAKQQRTKWNHQTNFVLTFQWLCFVLYLYKQFLRLGQNLPLSYPLLWNCSESVVLLCFSLFLNLGIWRTRVMCTCITFCWTIHLFNTTLISPLEFGERELCVLVLHSTGQDSYLTLLWLVLWRLKDENYVYLYYILLDQILSTFWLIPWHLENGSYVYLYYILLDQIVI